MIFSILFIMVNKILKIMKKVLVIGIGFLGNYIVKQLKTNNFVTLGTKISKTSKTSSLDITQKQDLEKIILEFNPDCIINCAASVDVDFLEKLPEMAYSINSDGVKNLAELSNKYSKRIIHISTDSIFDGIQGNYNENDIPNPINVYGKSKEIGEKYLRNIHQNHVIIRTNFYGIHNEGKFLFDWIKSSLESKKQISGFDDVIFSPVEIGNLSEIIQEFVVNDFNGTVNISSNDMITKYDFAIKIAKCFNYDPSLIRKKSIDSFNFIAKRPKNTSLDNTYALKILKSKILSVDDGLDKIKSLYK
jgi:dTDP-4-dehydrorhamnose reductase